MNENAKISEKEFAIIHEIHNNHLPDQRTIATRTGISLGLTNIIIKRLITRGYVKAKQLNRKKIQYILTPKGFSEKVNKSYNFTLKAVDNFRAIKHKIHELFREELNNGADRFMITGSNELADIVELAAKSLPEISNKYSRTPAEAAENSVLLKVIYSSVNVPEKTIDIMSYITNSGFFY